MDAEDKEFEVTAEMMIHQDIDDERTLEEEEALEESDNEELDDLQKEGDMPLEELLALYGCSDVTSSMSSSPPPSVTKPSCIVDDLGDTWDRVGVASSSVTESAEERADPVAGPSGTADQQENAKDAAVKKGPWYRPGADPAALARLRPVPERRSIRRLMNNNELQVQQQPENGDGEFTMWLDDNDSSSADDKDYDSTVSDEWKQEITVDSDHQAVVSDKPSYPTYRKNAKDRLLWNPRNTKPQKVSYYLLEVNRFIQSNASIPVGNADRDNEQALHILERCNHDVESALNELRRSSGVLSEGTTPWTEDECRKFEAGLRLVGKDFFQLKLQVPTRSVKELVEFYYVWKKTERYDAFAQHGKIGKKKFNLHPGYVSDFMERFLDPSDGDFGDLHYGATTLLAEVKKDSTRHLLEERARQYPKTVSAKTS